MRRGDVYWVTLDPTVGSGIREARPAVIVSSDDCNHSVLEMFAARCSLLGTLKRLPLPLHLLAQCQDR
ncbi:MAG: type II toxin-antitoxin system PemK/MazF family toxin [Ignavibacteria bacterium]|nr:type II toxin-antitoxin system PemK/MazF family toxin [Ignavibacteria bacterium]